MTEHLIRAGADTRKITMVHNWAPGAGFSHLAPACRIEAANTGTVQGASAHRDVHADAGTVFMPAARLHEVRRPLKSTGSDTTSVAHNN